MKKTILVTVSGGRSSAMMARHIQTSEKYKDYEKVYVFCNTGMERPETIDFLKNIEKHWGINLIKIEGVYSNEMNIGVGYKIVNWDDLNMTGRPFTEMIAHKCKGVFKGVPSIKSPYCSDMLKAQPCRKLERDLFGKDIPYVKAIGFRKEDMPKRISWAEIKEDTKRIFPLLTDFENPISQQNLNTWWDNEPFKLEIDGKYGNCELCWKKSTNNLIENIRKGTRFIDWHREMEKEYDSTFFRGRLTIDDLVKLAQEPITATLDFEEDGGSCVCNI